MRTFSYSLLEVSDPDLKITAVKGKSFLYTNDVQQIIINDRSIKVISKVIEERVFLKYKDKNEIAFIKGVEENYNLITQIDSTLHVGNWLDADYTNTAVIGYGISRKLSLGILSFGEPLQIMVPKKGKGFINPQKPFYTTNAQVVGIYSGTQEFENKFVFVSIQQAKNLLRYKENQITGIELKLNPNSDVDAVSEEIQEKLGPTYKVQTKEQLNELYYKVINTENFVSYLIFTLIVIIALFNVIGAIIMMIIDKKDNLRTLFNLGTTLKQVKQIFIFQGFLLTLFGMIIGLSLGTILVLIQKQFEVFMITQSLPYPVEFRITNLCIVIGTITVLGFLASKIASSRISKEFLEK